MKKVNRISYLLLVFSLILVACGRQDTKDAERLEDIDAAVESLYNAEMNDLADDQSVEHFEEVEADILAEKKEDLNEENTQKLNEIESMFKNAVKMYELEESIHQLFIDGEDWLIKEETLDANIESLHKSLAEIDSDQWTKYYDRQEEKLTLAEAQIEEMKAAESIGDFAGYYFDADHHYLITITEDSYEGFVPNSDDFFHYEIVEILHNSGDRIDLILHHEEIDTEGFYIPETTTELTLELIDDGAFLKGNSSVLRRLSLEEYKEKEKGLRNY